MNVILSALLTAALAAPAATATATASDDLKDVEAVLAYIKKHPRDVALVTDGIRHNADRAAPAASSIKIIHLAAYADGVKAGRISPRERVPVSRWNAYHVPGTDGGAHEAALKRLNPGKTVTLDQLVSAMIEESDNAAADLLRDRLGPARLNRIAKTRVESINGNMLRAFAGCRLPADACLKKHVRSGGQITPRLPSYQRQADWAETVTRVRPAVLHRVLGRLSKDPTARKHLEWPMRQPGADPSKLRIGTKGGALPGVISEAMYTALPGEKTRHTVFALRRLPEQTWLSGLRSYAHQQFIVKVATDPAFRARVRAALR